MTKTILCFSRSYLSALWPRVMSQGAELEALHIVQSDAEQRKIEAGGGRVVLNLAKLGREALAMPEHERPVWREPQDMRRLTGYDWSAIYADRYLPELSASDRYTVAGAIQDALERIFEEHRLSAVLSEPVAIFPTHYLLYLCKRTGVIPLLRGPAYFPGYFSFLAAMDMSTPVRRDAMSGAESAEMAQTVRSFVERVAEDKAGPVYHHKFTTARTRGIAGYLRRREGRETTLINPGFEARAFQLARLLRVRFHKARFRKIGDYMTAGAVNEHRLYMRNLMGGRGGYDTPPEDFAPGNVFFPLQFEPEAMLLYCAPDCRDQYAFVEGVLQALPDGHVLWIKEHPNQFGLLSHGRWRALRKRYSNLRLVYGRENGRHLIQRCGMAIAITSSAGMDAMVYGRSCAVMGDVFFRHFPGALPVRSMEALAAVLNDPSNYCTEAAPAFDRTPLIEALCAFGRKCYKGDPQPSPTLYEPANLRAIYDAVLNEVSAEAGVRAAG